MRESEKFEMDKENKGNNVQSNIFLIVENYVLNMTTKGKIMMVFGIVWDC